MHEEGQSKTRSVQPGWRHAVANTAVEASQRIHSGEAPTPLLEGRNSLNRGGRPGLRAAHELLAHRCGSAQDSHLLRHHAVKRDASPSGAEAPQLNLVCVKDSTRRAILSNTASWCDSVSDRLLLQEIPGSRTGSHSSFPRAGRGQGAQQRYWTASGIIWLCVLSPCFTTKDFPLESNASSLNRSSPMLSGLAYHSATATLWPS